MIRKPARTHERGLIGSTAAKPGETREAGNCYRDPRQEAAGGSAPQGGPASLTCRPPPLRRRGPCPRLPPATFPTAPGSTRCPRPFRKRRCQQGKRGERGKRERVTSTSSSPPKERPNRPLPTAGLRGRGAAFRPSTSSWPGGPSRPPGPLWPASHPRA